MEKTLKRNSNLLICIAELIVGVLLLINPVGFTRGIIVAFGIPLTLQGIGSIVYSQKSAGSIRKQFVGQGSLYGRLRSVLHIPLWMVHRRIPGADCAVWRGDAGCCIWQAAMDG